MRTVQRAAKPINKPSAFSKETSMPARSPRSAGPGATDRIRICFQFDQPRATEAHPPEVARCCPYPRLKTIFERGDEEFSGARKMRIGLARFPACKTPVCL